MSNCLDCGCAVTAHKAEADPTPNSIALMNTGGCNYHEACAHFVGPHSMWPKICEIAKLALESAVCGFVAVTSDRNQITTSLWSVGDEPLTVIHQALHAKVLLSDATGLDWSIEAQWSSDVPVWVLVASVKDIPKDYDPARITTPAEA